MHFKRRGRIGLRDKLAANNAADRFYALNAGVEPQAQAVIPAKRQYTKRTDGSSEHKEQCAVVDWWRSACGVYQLPEFALFAVPNGAFLGSGYIGAKKLKREGMRPGMLDLVLAVPRDQFHGMFIEMKYGTNKTSDEQDAVLTYLKYSGYSASVHWSAESAISAMKEYLA